MKLRLFSGLAALALAAVSALAVAGLVVAVRRSRSRR